MRSRPTVLAAGFVVALLAALVGLVLAWTTDSLTGNAQGFVPNAVITGFVIAAAVVAGLLVRDLGLRTSRWLPWAIAGMSFTLAFVPFALLTWGSPDAAALLYRGLRLPQGIERFWDMALVMRSVDCSSWGFDVFVDNNGCLQDAAIYGPGMLWLQFVPFGVFSFAAVPWLGVVLAAAASLGLAWLARASAGTGQIVLLVAAVGTPWLLLLERGNIDAVVILVAIVAVAIIRRWPTSLSSWAFAAALAWLMGTWKYYPFAMGLLLLPVLRLRRGWLVIAGYLVASVGYVLLTWSNFRFSASSNSGMTEIGDLVVLGRVPVVARLLGSTYPASGPQWGDGLVLVLAIAALVWGLLAAGLVRGMRSTGSMLALAGAPIYLASVLVAGFGWGYKTAFLLLCVPVLAFRRSTGPLLAASLTMLLLIAVASSVAANTLLASLAGITAASFALGFAGRLALRSITRAREARAA